MHFFATSGYVHRTAMSATSDEVYTQSQMEHINIIVWAAATSISSKQLFQVEHELPDTRRVPSSRAELSAASLPTSLASAPNNDLVTGPTLATLVATGGSPELRKSDGSALLAACWQTTIYGCRSGSHVAIYQIK